MSGGPYNLSTEIQVSVTFTDSNGNPADPTEITLEVQTPDGVQTDYTYPSQVTRITVGYYIYNVFLNQIGWWIYNWVGAGSLEATTGDQYFEVAETVFA